MKVATNTRSFLFLAVFSAAGAHAAWASEPAGDAQQQARTLLGGRNVSASNAMPRTAVESSMASEWNSVDAQDQARQMILGRPSSRLPNESALASARHDKTERANTASDSHKVEAGGDELARRMILGSAYSDNSTASVRRVPTMRVGGAW
jgi:hypothetical protein